MDLVATVKTAGTVVQFVEGGPLAEALAEINLTAAVSALDKARSASDQRAQVWSAVNHLEGALAAIESKISGVRGKVQIALRSPNFDLLCKKRGYVLALMALCYRYLGEEELALRAIEQGRSNPSDGMRLGSLLLALPSGAINRIDAIRWDFHIGKYDVDWSKFELPPRGLPTPEGPLT